MKRTLIRNLDAVVSLDETGTIRQAVDILIEGKKVKKIGEALAAGEGDALIDGSGKAAMPGFVNSHCHSPMTFERGYAEDLPFDRWLNEKIWVAESALTPDDVYWAAALAACEMIRSGTIAYNDHYFYMDRVAEVVGESGMKAALAWCVFGIGEESEVGPGLAGTLEWIQQAHQSAEGRIKAFLGPHSPYVCPPEFLAEVVALAQGHELGIHLHVAESEEQVQQSLDRYGQRPVQQLDSLGVFDVPGGCVAAHCLAIDEKDSAILAAKKVSVAHTPITYMKLAMPFPPLGDRLEKGIIVGLGTDGPGSNADMDMFATIRQTALIHKYQSRDPEQISGDLALRLATQSGAKALGFEGTGVLEEGAAADLILVNLDAPHMRPRHSLIANLVHSAKGADVTDVMVDGKWLMRDRELLTLDEEKILYEAERHALDMVSRGMKQMREYKA